MTAVTTIQSPLISFIERASRDTDFDIAKFSELLRMQREMEHEQSRRSFNRAMAACQAEMLPVVRDARNSHLNNRYAKLETIDAALRPIYTRHGFSVRYGSAAVPAEGMIRIVCTVAHEDGFWEDNFLDAPIGNTGSQGGRTQTTPVQAIGSAITYLRRYLLAMCLNVVLADDDDDGEGTRRIDARHRAPAPMPTMEAAPPKPDPVATIRDRLAACENAADVLKVGDAWGKAVAKAAAAGSPITPTIVDVVKDLLADRYGEFVEAEANEPEAEVVE